MAKMHSKRSPRPAALADLESGCVEHDPAASQAGDAAEIESFANDPGAVEIEPKLLKARYALEEQMGGFGAVINSLEAPSTDSGADFGNFAGWGIGEKVVGGRFSGDLAVKVYVAERLAASDVIEEALVPESVEDFPTDVEEVGDVSALRFMGRYRLAPGGLSVGHTRITAGTHGCLVVRSNKHLCILSNNHDLANCNAARNGDAIVQPGPLDGGRDSRDRVGTLEHFVPITFGGASVNTFDAAVVRTSKKLASPAMHSYRINPQPIPATLGMSVRKCGRTTDATLGVSGSVRVNYGSSGVALFRDQLEIRGVGGALSQGGDSGSLVVTACTRQPAGLLFAGGGDVTFANPIAAVVRALGIRQFMD